jgi:hypothetical protein
MYYKFDIENISEKNLRGLLTAISVHTDLVAAGSNPTFVGRFFAIVGCTKAEATSICDTIYGLNDGAYCSLEELTPDQVEEYL